MELAMLSLAHGLRTVAALTLLAAPGIAQVTSVAPFAGDQGTDFAAFSLFPIKGSMTSVGYISTPHITGVVGRTTAGAGALTLTPSAGGRMLSTVDHACVLPTILKWRLNQQADRVGMNFATADAAATDITVHLFDDQNVLIASMNETLPPGGNGWTWVGYESTISIRRVHIENHRAIANVSLLADTFVRGSSPDPLIGVAYGLATTNSTGGVARLTAHGSALLAEGNLTLHARDLPIGSLGVFLCADEMARVPLGDGFLLLGSSRFTRMPGQISQDGTLTRVVDVVSHPFAPGETWYFQAWFRDPLPGGQGSNLTQGVEIQFN